MKAIGKWSLALASFSLAMPAQAAPRVEIQPVQRGEETLRWDRGFPTLDLKGARGSVQVRRLLFDHGSMVFAVAVYNSSDIEADFDVENVEVSVGGKPQRAMSLQEVQAKAESRARWSQVGMALLGGFAVAGAASQRDHYTSTYRTPRGSYRFDYSTPSTAGQIEAAAIAAGTAYSIKMMRDRLDRTLGELGDRVVQRTTVGPSEGYGGQVIITKAVFSKMPTPVEMVVHWNGEDFRFSFRAVPLGTPDPTWIRKPLSPPAPAPQAPAPEVPVGLVPAAPKPTSA
ncbi:hypothetical protein J2W22_001263 [Sphingomonas kyeonggiensis]|uniref:hypothetical protein n=1 Tax=Sphingomonas kyeonggiensis TaxID=1268553 RepID=UPI0027858715|nr:hypothetical protein [Sphingomonas kyeonggiensis]MDQ0249216.1 hypothetical protein [Sphingomonas kyeonggiensis]